MTASTKHRTALYRIFSDNTSLPIRTSYVFSCGTREIGVLGKRLSVHARNSGIRVLSLQDLMRPTVYSHLHFFPTAPTTHTTNPTFAQQVLPCIFACVIFSSLTLRLNLVENLRSNPYRQPHCSLVPSDPPETPPAPCRTSIIESYRRIR